MLARTAPATRVFPGQHANSACGTLPFLYCTRTILRPHRSYRTPRKTVYNDGEDRDESEPGSRLKKGNLDEIFTPSPPKPKRKAQRRSKDPFGEAGFKVNDPWETVWKNPPPRRVPSTVKNDAQRARSNKAAPTEGGEEDDSYAPFAEWSGPKTEAVSTKPPKRVHRDASHVPFERTRGAPREDQYADLEGTTITPTEKKAFESLFKLPKPSIPPEPTSKPNISYKKVGRDEERPNSTLNPIIHKVSTKSPSIDTIWSSRPVPEFPEPLRRLREATLATQSTNSTSIPQTDPELQEESSLPPQSDITIRRMGTGEEASVRLQQVAQKDVFRIKQRMRHAQTDIHVWHYLHVGVLKAVMDLELDGPAAYESGVKRLFAETPLPQERPDENLPAIEDSGDRTTSAEDGATDVETAPTTELEVQHKEMALQDANDASPDDEPAGLYPQPDLLSSRGKALEILSVSLPKHLINAFTILTTNFPGSPLPLTIIPLMKSLGPSSAALGLSTELYNLHLRHHWRQYRDLIAIDQILQEMNENVYEFDQITFNFVDGVLRWIEDARRGEHGAAMKVVSRMDRALRGEKAVRGWVKVMTRRRYDEALRKAQEKEAVERERLEEEENRRATMGLSLKGADEVEF